MTPIQFFYVSEGQVLWNLSTDLTIICQIGYFHTVRDVQYYSKQMRYGGTTMEQTFLATIRKQSYDAVQELLAVSKLRPHDIFVVGCSSSEVLGEKIGTSTNLEVAEALYDGITAALAEKEIALAAQCCEHLNRALVVNRETMERYDLEQVNAIPQPNHAGGAFATVAYQKMSDAVLVEDLRAKASVGIDIGGTLIGMHIHPVVIPVRLSITQIGNAPIICARRRPKYVGGQRAIYDDDLY